MRRPAGWWRSRRMVVVEPAAMLTPKEDLYRSPSAPFRARRSSSNALALWQLLLLFLSPLCVYYALNNTVLLYVLSTFFFFFPHFMQVFCFQMGASAEKNISYTTKIRLYNLLRAPSEIVLIDRHNVIGHWTSKGKYGPKCAVTA